MTPLTSISVGVGQTIGSALVPAGRAQVISVGRPESPGFFQ